MCYIYDGCEYTYNELKQKIESSRTGVPKVANNTFARMDRNGNIDIVLHGNTVVTVHKNGNFTLDSCGWQTGTTKERINRFSPVTVSQKNYVWYINGETEFFDGIVVDSSGNVV